MESGKPARFVPPQAGVSRYGDYELRILESGEIETREGSLHDFFNALAWLVFPRTKSRLNALHARRIPVEGGRRGRFRDLLTLIDEGGAIVECADAELARMLGACEWKALFWDSRERVRRSMRIHVVGHAVLEQSLKPWPGITCKVIFVAPGADIDSRAADWLGALPTSSTPRQLPSLPVFGYPGWDARGDVPGFYDDARYFRPFRRGNILPGVGRAAAAQRHEGRAEESPGSAERDAG